MRKISLIALVAAGVFFFSIMAGSQEAYYSGAFARISYIRGEAVVDRTQDLGLERAEVNLVLTTGDKVETEDGLLEISFGRNNFLRVGPYSVLEIVKLPEYQGDEISLYLYSGRFYLRLSHLQKERSFSLHTPDASFYALEEGLFSFEIEDQSRTRVSVIEGALEVAARDESLLLEAGDSVEAEDGYLYESLYYHTGGDDFSLWNRDRDRLLYRASYQSSSYLPEEIREYEPELSAYGRWVYERPYGYVWVPVVVQVDWRPYLNGRWVWYPRIGWTWVSAEPWGWAVYHYGRWHWRLGLGWYWIPTVYWGPAWVHWYWDAQIVAWCPLSYWNRPVVIINNYFYDRYDDRYYPVHSRALVVVRRNQLQALHSVRTLVGPESLKNLEKIRLEASQPQIKPTPKPSVTPSALRPASSGLKSINPASERPLSSSQLKSPSTLSHGQKITTEISRPETKSLRTSELRISEANPAQINRTPGSGSLSRSSLSYKNNHYAGTGQVSSRRLNPQSSPRNLTENSSISLRRKPELRSDSAESSKIQLRSPSAFSETKSLRKMNQTGFSGSSGSFSSSSIQERKSSYNLPSLARPYNPPAAIDSGVKPVSSSSSANQGISKPQSPKSQSQSSSSSSSGGQLRKKDG